MNHHILIVDDNQMNREIVKGLLIKSGYQVVTAESGKKALELLEQLPFDLILLDVVMDEIDGYQVCKILKEGPGTADIPIIFLTARDDEKSVKKGFESGAIDYVRKPFLKEELLARVRTHLDLQHTILQLNSEIKSREVTEEKLHQSLDDLKILQHDLIVLERTNTAMAMGITANHELNQPLQVLSGNLELLLSTLDFNLLSEEQQQFASQIRQAMDRIQTILKKYRELTSVEMEPYHDSVQMLVMQNGSDSTDTES